MNLVVHSERARAMAETLAERLGQSVSEVVEQVLQKELATVPASRHADKLTPEEKFRRINEIVARLPPVPSGVTSDHSDRYDEDGLPA